ncbi:alpha/beta fold hydrolase [Kocuria rosea]|uniref:alpha/beta fold hydrolase n=1 Tax=Kocuria rosea TaxID=1275 RepID=UPI0018D2025F|nr:alpha/beta hydrolase [Kocuria polaris]
MTDRGYLGPGLPFLRVGSGPAVVLLPGLSAHHRLPEGAELTAQLAQLRILPADRTVWWINRRHRLPAGATMAGIAGDYAAVLQEQFTEETGGVDVVGVSTGASVALQLALDHPGLVRRLVLVSGAHRLGPRGRWVQQEVARSLRRGEVRRAGALTMATMGATAPTSRALGVLGWLLGVRVLGSGDPDLLTTIDAEDAFDVGDRMSALGCPLLVVDGARDRFYTPQLLHETAARAPRGHLVLYPRRGHLSTQLVRRLPTDVGAFLALPS